MLGICDQQQNLNLVIAYWNKGQTSFFWDQMKSDVLLLFLYCFLCRRGSAKVLYEFLCCLYKFWLSMVTQRLE